MARKKETSKADAIKHLFGSLKTHSRMVVFETESAFGIAIGFSEQNFGFGEIVFSVDKNTGEASFDNEAMSMEHCAKILMRTVGTEVKVYTKE